MFENQVFTALEKWIQSCSGWVPLEVSADHPGRSSLSSLIVSYPNLRGHVVEAVLGLRIGSIDRAHEIVQHGSTSLDRYLHGVVHRIEGDFWNAKYWFRQVEDRALLARIGNEVMETLKSKKAWEASTSLMLFDDQNRFAPQHLVDAQAALASKSTLANRDLIQQVAQAEWDAIWKIIKDDNDATKDDT